MKTTILRFPRDESGSTRVCTIWLEQRPNKSKLPEFSPWGRLCNRLENSFSPRPKLIIAEGTVCKRCSHPGGRTPVIAVKGVRNHPHPGLYMVITPLVLLAHQRNRCSKPFVRGGAGGAEAHTGQANECVSINFTLHGTKGLCGATMFRAETVCTHVWGVGGLEDEVVGGHVSDGTEGALRAHLLSITRYRGQRALTTPDDSLSLATSLPGQLRSPHNEPRNKTSNTRSPGNIKINIKLHRIIISRVSVCTT